MRRLPGSPPGVLFHTNLVFSVDCSTVPQLGVCVDPLCKLDLLWNMSSGSPWVFDSILSRRVPSPPATH